ncbi:MAG: IS110 family transposase [Candidatus Acidiferrales bacterium]
MMIIGCDLHTRFQQIAMLDTETGEIVERRLEHETGEAQAFYAALGAAVRVGVEATGYARWFERMLREQGHELWIGDASAIRAARVRQQKTDARDAQLLLSLLVENRFPKIWVSSPAERDLWQLLRHRDKLVRFRTSVRNQLHALAMGEGVCRKKKLWTKRGRQELESLALGEWASRRRGELLAMLDRLSGSIQELDQAVKQQAAQHPSAVQLMQQPGVGPITGLALALAVGPVERFPNSRKLVSYLGLNPREASSGGKQRLGAISKQGNSLVRWLLVEAAQTASRKDEGLRRVYQRLVHRRGRAVAKVAIARKLAVRLYWQLRHAGTQPSPPARMQGSPPSPVVPLAGPTS